MLDPEIQFRTRRCLLRRVSMAEAEAIHIALTHPGFMEFLLDDPPKVIAETRERIAGFLATWDSGTRFVFAAHCNDGFIGVTGLRPFGELGTWNVGFWIVPGQWGRGFAGELAQQSITVAFQLLNASRVRLAHAFENRRSQRTIEKLGLRCDGESSFGKNGITIRERVYHLSKTEWESRGLAAES